MGRRGRSTGRFFLRGCVPFPFLFFETVSDRGSRRRLATSRSSLPFEASRSGQTGCFAFSFSVVAPLRLADLHLLTASSVSWPSEVLSVSSSSTRQPLTHAFSATVLIAASVKGDAFVSFSRSASLLSRSSLSCTDLVLTTLPLHAVSRTVKTTEVDFPSRRFERRAVEGWKAGGEGRRKWRVCACIAVRSICSLFLSRRAWTPLNRLAEYVDFDAATFPLCLPRRAPLSPPPTTLTFPGHRLPSTHTPSKALTNSLRDPHPSSSVA